MFVATVTSVVRHKLKHNSMSTKREIDWRIEAEAELSEGLPPAFPGGPSFKPGDRVILMTMTRDSTGQPFGFVTPSATALALSIAMDAAKKAKHLQESLEHRYGPSPDGTAKTIHTKHTGKLFKFFEQSMIAVTFSFQALESFCNHSIRRNVQEPINIRRRKTVVTMTPEELQRELSTEYKLAKILPKIYKTGTPSGKAVWEKFKNLKAVRDSTVHLKGADQVPMGKVDKSSLFFQFLNNHPNDYPRTASDLINHFFKRAEKPLWLSRAPLVSD